jgi:midasin
MIRTPHADAGVLFLAIRCYCLQSGMGEAERVKMEKQVIGDVSERDCPITYGMDIDGTMLQMDGWTFPAFEVRRISDARISIAQEALDYYLTEEGEAVEPIKLEELR